MLEVTDLTVRYGRGVAVDRLSLAVNDGEVVCVLGPSGSGKSTLLRAIAGLETPEGGSITRGGTDLTAIPTHRRELGLMFQDHALFPHRDVLGNVIFGLRMHEVDRETAVRRGREVLELVGLGGFERRGVRELSGGEQQRVALARALAPEPKLLMLDEPLGALDRSLREELTAELRALFTRLGLSVLLVTHDHDEAFAIGDRVAVMHAGRIEQVGSPAEVWNAPASAFVADFLGWNVTRALSTGICAVRPDALRVAADGDLSGHVVVRTFRRDHFLVGVAIDGTDEVLDVVVRDVDPPDVGDAVRLTADPSGVVALP